MLHEAQYCAMCRSLASVGESEIVLRGHLLCKTCSAVLQAKIDQELVPIRQELTDIRNALSERTGGR